MLSASAYLHLKSIAAGMERLQPGSFRVSDPAFEARVLSAAGAQPGAVGWTGRKTVDEYYQLGSRLKAVK